MHIGVLIVPPIQLLDISPIDLFAMLTRSYFQACNFPQPLIDQAVPDSDLKITYISHTGANSTSPTTAHLGLHIDAGLDDPKVAPGKLDLLLIPGPPPGVRPPEEVLDFVRQHVAKGGELMTICTGVFVAAFAGVLDGKTACPGRGVDDILRRDFPKVKWVDKRFANDGKIWTSGGITNGFDLVGTYLRQKFPNVGDLVLKMADYEVRAQEYDTPKPMFSAWWVFQILGAWVRGLTRRKSD